MKLTTRFMLRAGLVLCAAGALGAFGACGKDTPVQPTSPPPPPPPLAPPAGLTATPVGQTQIDLAWTDNTTTETGFQVQRCTGAGCANFAQVGSNLAANSTSYSDMGLTANTSYSYRARAITATDSSVWTSTQTAVTGSVVVSSSFTLVGAGEISTSASTAGPTATAQIVEGILNAEPEAVAFSVGNNIGDNTPGVTFASSTFGNTWGKFKGRTYYSLGNGDFDGGRGPSGVYAYFGDRTGSAGKGWFSFNKGAWHIVVLNTSDWEHGKAATFGTHFDGTCNPPTGCMVLDPSEQVDWLTQDLSTARQGGIKCIAVLSWERRVYTSGVGNVEPQANMRPMASIMMANKVDLIISAKDKVYSRFAQMDLVNMKADPNGVRQFIVGTGGRSPDQAPQGNPPLREVGFALPEGSWGVLKLTLGDGNYGWEFVNTNAASANQDKSAAPVACHQ